VLVPLAVFCLWAGGWPWDLLVGAATLGLAVEWITLCGRRVISPAGLSLIVCTLAVWTMALQGHAGAALAFTVIATPVIWRTGFRAPLAWSLAAGLPYIGFGAVALVWLREMPGTGLADVLLLLLIVWASDIGAYMAGRAIGGAKLAPSISPGKTRSGAIGGLLAATLVGAGAAGWFGGSLWALMPVAAGLSIVAQSGDLLESYVKRCFGVKDSGWLIPGHGGLFDRLDGLLAAAPVAAMLAFALGRGVVL
jgi:phosphatidate cytidylyltransferase